MEEELRVEYHPFGYGYVHADAVGRAKDVSRTLDEKNLPILC